LQINGSEQGKETEKRRKERGGSGEYRRVGRAAYAIKEGGDLFGYSTLA